MREGKRALVSGAIFGGLLLLCLWFVGWIGRLAFDNTCIELKEQYINSAAGETAGEIVAGVNFGKSIDSFYGMDQILERFQALSPGNMEAAVLGGDGLPRYLSFEEKEYGREYLARLLGGTYQEALRTSLAQGGGTVPFGSRRSMVLPLNGQDGSLLGSVALIYDTGAFISKGAYGQEAAAAILAVLTVCMAVFYFLSGIKKIPEKSWGRLVPVLAVMAGVMAQIMVLYGHYQAEYENLIYENAGEIARGVGEKADSLLEKGLPEEAFGRLAEYFAEKAYQNDVIWNIRITRPYADTRELLHRPDQDTIVTHLGHGSGTDVLVSVNRNYIEGQMGKMTASFLIIFAICAMVSYELVKLIDILGLRMAAGENTGGDTGRDGDVVRPAAGACKGQAVSLQIKLLSFVIYTGIYASMPYAAVLMRTWNASVWGLSPEVSASLPLTLELTGIMVWSMMIPKFLGKARLPCLLAGASVVLIGGNIGCAAVSGPYGLIAMRGITSLGFALFKYAMNSIVAAGSGDGTRLNSNYALLNAGLLGGITVGGSIGAIVAESMGYQMNYYFTAAIILAGFAAGILLMPWGLLEREREAARGQAAAAGIRLGTVLKSPRVVMALILGAVPLNIGLMYVVAFLPVYMDNVGQSALAVSYAYLINGICGVYIGVSLVRLLKWLPQRLAVTVSMALGAVGILVLTVDHSLALVMVSAGVMGLFDGYGTPNVTGFFASLPEVKRMDGAQALTVFNVAGSAVQIICPLLYNVTVQADGKTTYLTILGLGFAAVAAALLVAAGEKGNMNSKGEAA